MVRRRISDWPGRKSYSSARCSGTSKLMATASSHSRVTSATVSVWNRVRAGAGAEAITSDLLHVLERLVARTAAAQRLARRRGEPRGLHGVRRTALRAGDPAGRWRQRQRDRPGATGRGPGRSDPRLGELAPPLFGDPVAAPRRV